MSMRIILSSWHVLLEFEIAEIAPVEVHSVELAGGRSGVLRTAGSGDAVLRANGHYADFRRRVFACQVVFHRYSIINSCQKAKARTQGNRPNANNRLKLQKTLMKYKSGASVAATGTCRLLQIVHFLDLGGREHSPELGVVGFPECEDLFALVEIPENLGSIIKIA